MDCHHLLLTWSAVVCLSCLPAPASSENVAAVLRLRQNACLAESAAQARFLGSPTRLSCIVECAKTKKSFDAVQMLPGALGGSFDCECVRLYANSTPCCRTNCERWDVISSEGSSGGTSTPNNAGSLWNLTTCPGISDAWKPVVYVNKCIYRVDGNINFDSASASTSCGTDGQLFEIQDSETESQLVKYVNYLSSIDNALFWARDSRSGTGVCAFSVASGSRVSAVNPCANDSGGVPRQLRPICAKNLAFPGASLADILVVKIGSTGLLWYYFNPTEANYNDSCSGKQKARIESSDSYNAIRTGIWQRAWNGSQVWISNTGSHLPSEVTAYGNCIALTINALSDAISTAASSRECTLAYRSICQDELNIGSSRGGGTMTQSPGIVTNSCPLPIQPPSGANDVRTVGFLCFYYTGNSVNMSSVSSPSVACGSDQYIPALIDGDYIKARNYVFNIRNILASDWEAWLWTSSAGGGLTVTNGDPITSTITDGSSGSYYMNSTGSPFRGYSNVMRPVICRSNAEVCPSAQNFLNFAAATNSCVALQPGAATSMSCSSNCAAMGGSMAELQSQEKFNQIRDIIFVNGRESTTFWVNNGTVGASGNCVAIRVTSPSASWSSSLIYNSCESWQGCICEKPM